MISLPNNLEQFADDSYWENFFKNLGDREFEWYGEYKDFSNILLQVIKPQDKILIIGCGSSNLSFSLCSEGFLDITNIDISDKVITQLTEKSKNLGSKMSFLKMDVLQMTFPDATFNAVLDKGTLDALAHGPGRETYEKLSKMWTQIIRVSRDDFNGKTFAEEDDLARYVSISLAQGHILEMIGSYFFSPHPMTKSRPNIHVIRLKVFVVEKVGELFPIFAFAFYLSKPEPCRNTIFQSVDVNGDVTQYESYAQLVGWIKTHQYHYALKQKGQRENGEGDHELSFHLFAKEQDKEPRYTFYLTKCPDEDVENDGNHKFAAFIVPLGREGEWLFNTPKGRITLAKSARYKRLIIVHLNRNHTYKDGMDAIKDELSPAIKRYRPDDVLPVEKIPILSLGDDTLERKVIEKGMTSCSGYEYLVEDVKLVEHDFWLRRLYFLNAPSLIQSEIRLRVDEKGHLTPDLMGPLQFEHHKAMITAIATTFPDVHAQLKCLIIGLGGGALPTFLLNFIPSMEITVVEIDQKIVSVATKLFGYQGSHSTKCQTNIDDGLAYLANKPAKFDIILIDVNSNNPSEVLSSPPASFITPEHLELFCSSLNKNGLLMTTLLTRDPQEIKSVEEIFSREFVKPFSRALIDLGDEELDKVIQITRNESILPSETEQNYVITQRYSKFGEYIAKIFKAGLKEKNEPFDVAEYVLDLEIFLARKIF